MPITYEVLRNGHYIHALAAGNVSGSEFIKYEIDHAADEKVSGPLMEILEINYGALREINSEDVKRIIDIRKKEKPSVMPHKCAIVISAGDAKSWDIAKFYEGMVELHLPETVIVFGDLDIARTWLGV